MVIELTFGSLKKVEQTPFGVKLHLGSVDEIIAQISFAAMNKEIIERTREYAEGAVL